MRFGAVLAAGASARLRTPKQLLLVAGEPLVRRSARVLLDAGLSRVAVVTGHHAERVAEAVGDLPVVLVPSADPSEGVAASVRAAAGWANGSADALLLSVCDQPLLSSRHLRALIDRFELEPGPVASHYAGRAGVPALLPSSHFQALLGLRGDRGAASVLRELPPRSLVAWPEGEHDIDTVEDAARWAPRI